VGSPFVVVVVVVAVAVKAEHTRCPVLTAQEGLGAGWRLGTAGVEEDPPWPGEQRWLALEICHLPWQAGENSLVGGLGCR